jgi:tripartite-type tricarboxylate transporter receptor subunit TctC
MGFPASLASSVVLLCSLLPATAAAQSYPARAIRFVTPYPAGGFADLTARPIGQKLSELWGQSVVVENRAGASGMIGADLVAKSAPDGYTVLIGSLSEAALNVLLFRNMSYDPVKDLQPVTLATVAPLLMAVHPSLPVKSVKELVALARAKPGALSYASIGNGTPHHFAGEFMKTALNLDIAHVPYKGGAPALIDLIGGHVPVGFVAMTSAIPNVKLGRLRAVAVTSLQRSSALPNLPTVNESGLPGFDITQWIALWVPAKTPKDIVDKLNRDAVKIIQGSEFKQLMLEAGTEAVGSSAEHLGRLQSAEIEKYRKIAAAAGIMPQ